MSWGALVAVIFWGASFIALKIALNELVSIYQYLQPLVATLLGVVVLHESVVWATVVGGLMTLSGVALVKQRVFPNMRFVLK